jgi:thimet oligopeptidase
MQPSHIVAAALIALAGATGAQTRPAVPLFDATTIAARCDGELAKARAAKQKAEVPSAAAGVLAEIDRLLIDYADFAYPVYLLQHVSPDKAVRDAAQACLEKLLPFESELYQSEPLYRRVQALRATDAIDKVFRQDLLEKFEDGGAALPPRERARAKQIADELEALDLRFSKNIN